MRVALIVEGRSDAAVITSILKGQLDLSRSDITYMVPELEYDETSLHKMRLENFSNWTIVRNCCMEQRKIDEFLDCSVDDRFVVIHIDSDTRMETGYDVREPQNLNTEDDILQLRQNIKLKLISWLDNHFNGKVAFAIAIQEIESWLLSLYGEEETDLLPNPKERFNRLLEKTSKVKEKDKLKIKSMNENKFEKYEFISKDFKKIKNLKNASGKSVSLRLFCTELDSFCSCES